MISIVFKGPSDIRILAAADLEKAGVGGFTKTSFYVDQPKEVSKEVGEAILADPELFGKFSLVEEVEEVQKAEAKPEKAEEKADTSSTSKTVPTPSTGTRNGSSSTPKS